MELSLLFPFSLALLFDGGDDDEFGNDDDEAPVDLDDLDDFDSDEDGVSGSDEEYDEFGIPKDE